MDVKVTDQTFVKSTSPENGMDVIRRGAEMIVDFPEIIPIRTQFRVDAAYTYTKYIDNSLSYYYPVSYTHLMCIRDSCSTCRFLILFILRQQYRFRIGLLRTEYHRKFPFHSHLLQTLSHSLTPVSYTHLHNIPDIPKYIQT